MTSAIITIIAILIGLIGGILERRYSSESINKRKSIKRDNEIAEKDHHGKSKRLSDLLDAAKLRNKRNDSNS